MLQLSWLKVDFDKWKDEDDEADVQAEPNLGGMQGFDMEQVRDAARAVRPHTAWITRRAVGHR